MSRTARGSPLKKFLRQSLLCSALIEEIIQSERKLLRLPYNSNKKNTHCSNICCFRSVVLSSASLQLLSASSAPPVRTNGCESNVSGESRSCWLRPTLRKTSDMNLLKGSWMYYSLYSYCRSNLRLYIFFLAPLLKGLHTAIRPHHSP